jgi:hypothetical protein
MPIGWRNGKYAKGIRKRRGKEIKRVQTRHRREIYVNNPVHATYVTIGDASH